MTKNIMIVGVGGQGTLLASKILGSVLLDKGYDVKVSEVHGMSQRGGSVVTYVRYGEQVFSPVICEGEAELLLSFEQLETARWLPFLKKGGKIMVNRQVINPMPVITGAAAYPEGLFEKIRGKGVDLIEIDALSLALQAGNSKAVNVVLLGLLASKMDIEKESFIKALHENVPPKFIDLNLKAFELGFSAK